MLAALLSTLLSLSGGSDFATTLKNATGADFWIEMVPGAAPQAAHSAAIIDAPVETVAAIYRDVDRFKELFPQMTESRVTQRAGRIINAHIAVVIIGWKGIGRIPLQGDIRQIEQHEGEAVWFHQRLAGGESSFKRYEIDLRLSPLPANKCLLEMWGMAVPNIPLVPDSLIETENRKLVRRGVRAVRLRAAGAKFDPNDL